MQRPKVEPSKAAAQPTTSRCVAVYGCDPRWLFAVITSLLKSPVIASSICHGVWQMCVIYTQIFLMSSDAQKIFQTQNSRKSPLKGGLVECEFNSQSCSTSSTPASRRTCEWWSPTTLSQTAPMSPWYALNAVKSACPYWIRQLARTTARSV